MSTGSVVSSKNPELRTIKAGEFKATCLALLDEESLREQPLAITKHGKVVAHLVAPPADKPFRSIVGLTPYINVPSREEWGKWKAEMTSNWRDPGEKFGDLLHQQRHQEQKRKKRKKS